MQDWQAWDPCTVTCGKGTQKRRRFCSAAVNNGKTCPDRRKNIKLYVQVKDCQIKSCPDPMWTAWTATDCTVSCGVGTFTKSRNCEDFNTGDKMDPFLDCGATDQTDLIQTEKCEKPHCPGIVFEFSHQFLQSLDLIFSRWRPNWMAKLVELQYRLRTRRQAKATSLLHQPNAAKRRKTLSWPKGRISRVQKSTLSHQLWIFSMGNLDALFRHLWSGRTRNSNQTSTH